MDDYEKYEEDCKAIREANKNLLGDFEAQLKSTGLSKKTIDNHISNIDFYINEYLLYEDATEARDGVNAVGMFLGYWFIKKPCGQVDQASKVEKSLIDKDDLSDLKETIKERMPEWLATLERYDDPSVEDVW